MSRKCHNPWTRTRAGQIMRNKSFKPCGNAFGTPHERFPRPAAPAETAGLAGKLLGLIPDLDPAAVRDLSRGNPPQHQITLNHINQYNGGK